MILKVRLSMARPSFSARSGADPFGPPNARTQKAIPWLLPAPGSPTGILPHLVRVQPRRVRNAHPSSPGRRAGQKLRGSRRANRRRASRVCRRRARSASRYRRRRERPARRSQEARRRGRSAARTTLIAAHCAQPLLTKRQHAAVSGPRRCPGSCPRRPRPARRSPPPRS